MDSSMLLPPPPNNPSSKLMTIFWCIISAASTYASLTSLTTMQCFKSLTHPYTNSIIILSSVPIATLHLALFFNLNSIPTLDNKNLAYANLVFDTFGNIIRFGSIWFPSEDSPQVIVFFVGLTLDVMAVTKLVKPNLDVHVLRHTQFAGIVRVSRMCFSRNGGSYWYLCVFLYAVLVLSFNYCEVARIRRMNNGA